MKPGKICSYLLPMLFVLVLTARAQTVELLPLDESVIKRLHEEGQWSVKAAERCWMVNEKRFRATHDVAPQLLETEMRLLTNLHPTGKMSSILEHHPEMSGLLLLAPSPADVTDAIMQASDGDQEALIASYWHCTDGISVRLWTEVIRRHRPLVVFFQQKCAALPYQGMFAYQENMHVPEARDIYAKWLDDVLAPAVLSQSDETLSSRLHFVTTSGTSLRRRLEGDEAFRKGFLAETWPRFREAMVHLSQNNRDKEDVFYLCGGEPLVWEFFQREDSAKLFKQVGMEAVIQLCGDNALHNDVREAVAAMWAKQILDLPQAIQRYQEDAYFRELVRRLKAEDDWPLLNGVCRKLNEAGASWPSDAGYLSRLGTSALRKEVHPQKPSIIPGAALVSLTGRFLDGRRVGFQEVFAAGMDVVDLASVVATGGGALVAKKAVMKVAKAGLQQTLESGARESLEKLAGRTIKELGKDVPGAEWPQALAQKAMALLPKKIQATLAKSGLVEISNPVKAGFDLSRRMGMGREQFKKLSGLEARVFMRKDGRVFVNFTPALTKPSPVASFLTRTIENDALDSAPARETAAAAGDAVRQWKEDISAWWSGLATEQL